MACHAGRKPATAAATTVRRAAGRKVRSDARQSRRNAAATSGDRRVDRKCAQDVIGLGVLDRRVVLERFHGRAHVAASLEDELLELAHLAMEALDLHGIRRVVDALHHQPVAVNTVFVLNDDLVGFVVPG
jgi:hypothetical protein